MIFDDLVTTTKAMHTLQKRKAQKDNKDKQENTDTKYRLLLTRANSFVDAVEYLYTTARVPSNSEILIRLTDLLNDLEQIIQEGLASNDRVMSVEKSFITLQNSMKKEWAKQYADYTGAAAGTLEAIRSIEPERVRSCLEKIKSAEIWDTDINVFKRMREGLDDADQLIIGLGLDDEIITFLTNTNSGKATLQDLSDKVLAWIRNENLEKKIRISFVKTM